MRPFEWLGNLGEVPASYYTKDIGLRTLRYFDPTVSYRHG